MRVITVLPLWVFALLLIGLTALTMCGPYLIRRRVAFERLRTNNEVAGFKFATVGVLYAVLLAFAIVVVWQKFDDADNAVAREAGAAANIYRLSYGLGEASGTALRDRMSAYLEAVIDHDWPAMAHGGESPAATQALNRIYSATLADHSGDRLGAVALGEILAELDQVTSARRERLVMSAGVVPNVLWLVLFVGAALTIGFTFFFGSENLRAQALMTGTLSLLIFGGLLIIIAVDYPFTGPVSVDPAPLEQVLIDFGRH
jgi:Protein of unknown function (DUF4239)